MPAAAAFVLWNGTPGGAENLVLRLCRALRESGDVNAEMWFLSSGGALGRQASSEGIPVRELGFRSGVESLWSRIECDAPSDDRVLVMSGYGPAVLSALRSGCKGVVVVEHGGALLNPRASGTRKAALAKASRRLMSRRVDAEICVSEYMHRLQSTIPHARELVVIRNGVDLQEFGPREWTEDDLGRIAEGHVRLRCAGRLLPEKGFRYVLEAVRMLADGGADPTLEIAGDGSDRSRLEALAEEMTIRCRVSFKGAIADMAGFWRSGDVAVAPSYPLEESFGMTSVEAAACRLPVVASNTSGLAETVEDGVTGVLVQPGDAGAIAATVQTYACNPSLLAVHGRAGRERCEREYSIQRTAREYAELIRTVGAK